MSTDSYQTALRTIMSLIQRQRNDEAVDACEALLESQPNSNDALLLMAKARQQQARYEDMLQLVERALRRDALNVGLQLQYIGALQFCGKHDQAISHLATIEQNAKDDAGLLQKIAANYVLAGQYSEAHQCYLRAIELQGNNPVFWGNLASSYIAVGDLQQAEQAYSKVIGLTPNNYDAWYNRSTVRKQTRDSNHVGKLERTIKKLPHNDPGATPLNYALAKEYDDLGDDKRSFSALERGAKSLRRLLKYDVQAEVSLMRRITELFDEDYARNVAPATGHRGPIFVLGLPRSGTTLVDRILSSHSEVESKGEITDFARTLTRLCKSTDKHVSLERSVQLSPEKFARTFVDSLDSYGLGSKRIIDKTPTNYLYIGLINKALPDAPIVHVRRHPVDSCLAMYRTLFKMAYPFSYDLDDLAEYYIAYDALMQHWRTLFSDKLLEVSYEDLVKNQERVSKEMIAHCGLRWEDQCLEFDKNSAPVATASAVQVRKPMYRDALARWRRFEPQLEPLINKLKAAGIEI